MLPEILTDEILPMRRGRLNLYSTDDIKRWGAERFMDAVCRKEPLEIPDLGGFTAAENAAMDEILRQEREASARGL